MVIKKKEKELMDFIEFLEGRGLLSLETKTYDYEKAIYEYLKKQK